VDAVAQLSLPTTHWCVVGLIQELWATLLYSYTLMLRMLVELLLLILLGAALLLLLPTTFVVLVLWWRRQQQPSKLISPATLIVLRVLQVQLG